MGGPRGPKQLRECSSSPTMAARPAAVPHPPWMTLSAVITMNTWFGIPSNSLRDGPWASVRLRACSPRRKAGRRTPLSVRRLHALLATTRFQADQGDRGRAGTARSCRRSGC